MLTRSLTEKFSLKHPIILAPMTGVATVGLAFVVSSAGGLGLIGGGYGGPPWLKKRFLATIGNGYAVAQ